MRINVVIYDRGANAGLLLFSVSLCFVITEEFK